MEQNLVDTVAECLRNMDILGLLMVIFTGLTACGVWAAWHQARPILKVSWGDLQTGPAKESGQAVFRATKGFTITNPSIHADRFDHKNSKFKMSAPRHLQVRSWESREGVAFQVRIPGQPVIPPVSDTSGWECELTFWDLEQWAGQNIEGVITVRTLRKTFSRRVKFTVPPIPDSTE